jgi:hypothetical protein
MFIVHISNKKGSDLKDIQANTTPLARFSGMRKLFDQDTSADVLEAIEGGIEIVTGVTRETMESSGNHEVDKPFAKVAELAAKSQVEELTDRSAKRTRVAGTGHPRAGSEFGCWLEDQDISAEKFKSMSTEDRLKKTQEFMRDTKYHRSLPHRKVKGSDPKEYAPYSPPYDPYAKVWAKVGELHNGSHLQTKKIRQQLSAEELGASSVAEAGKIKTTEAEAVDRAHQGVVDAITSADEKDGFPKKDDEGRIIENGKRTQAYIHSTMEAMHFDTYIDMMDQEDDKMIVQMGVAGVRPSHVRSCLADMSGYDMRRGDRDGLKKHLRKTCSLEVDPVSKKSTGAIVIRSDDGETIKRLIDDTWRTAGTNQKVASGIGDDMRECLSEKVKSGSGPASASVESVRPLLRSLIIRELDRIKNGN